MTWWSPAANLPHRRGLRMESLKTIEEAHREADTAGVMTDIGRAARAAAHVLSLASTETKNRVLRHAAATIRARERDIRAANGHDVASAKASGTTPAFLDRLALDSSRVEAMASGLD